MLIRPSGSEPREQEEIEEESSEAPAEAPPEQQAPAAPPGAPGLPKPVGQKPGGGQGGAPAGDGQGAAVAKQAAPAKSGGSTKAAAKTKSSSASGGAATAKGGATKSAGGARAEGAKGQGPVDDVDDRGGSKKGSGTAAKAPASPAQAVADRVKNLEERARALAASGDFEASALAAQVVKLAQKIADAAEGGDQSAALLQAGKALLGTTEKSITKLADLVASTKVGLRDLLAKAPNEAERKRVGTLMDVYDELDLCCRELANAFVSHNMARRKMFLPKVAAAVDKAKEGVAAAKPAPAKT